MAYKSIPLVNVSIIVKTWPGIPFAYASPLPIARSAPFSCSPKYKYKYFGRYRRQGGHLDRYMIGSVVHFSVKLDYHYSDPSSSFQSSRKRCWYQHEQPLIWTLSFAWSKSCSELEPFQATSQIESQRQWHIVRCNEKGGMHRVESTYKTRTCIKR
jgi:hypothetical protein